MTDTIADGLRDPEGAAKLRVVRAEVDRLGHDVASLGQSVSQLVTRRAREKPGQTVMIALAIGWLVGKHL